MSDGPGRTWTGVDWVPMGLGALMGTTVAGLVVWLQYSRRWTARARAPAVVGVVASVGLPMVLPWGAAFFCQRLFATERVDANGLVVGIKGNPPARRPRWPVTGGTVRVQFPVEVTGAPAGYRMRVVRMDATAGTEEETSQADMIRYFAPRDGGPVYGLTVGMRRSEYVPRQEEPARLRGRLYLAVLAPRGKYEFTFDNQRQRVPGVGVCQANYDQIALFYCRTPFRTPIETRVTFQFRDAQGGRAVAALPPLSSLSPFPFEFSLAPMTAAAAAINRLDYSGELSAGNALVGGRITYETWAPVAYLEREFDVVGRSLGDYRTQSGRTFVNIRGAWRI